ncbi:hypothetical protein BS50DRAFT_634055 [Corynespora cassiicola Philippines]|uniref:Uncharacterized protein n=1 Tax=Corynespora cassiicola Philippines TaxID=1448308 RepID=A0A2T2NSW9_CORCC|nr:hypothetical protein BS50DRAFT_634055 [Corynespora cassiicola Philippines]
MSTTPIHSTTFQQSPGMSESNEIHRASCEESTGSDGETPEGITRCNNRVQVANTLHNSTETRDPISNHTSTERPTTLDNEKSPREITKSNFNSFNSSNASSSSSSFSSSPPPSQQPTPNPNTINPFTGNPFWIDSFTDLLYPSSSTADPSPLALESTQMALLNPPLVDFAEKMERDWDSILARKREREGVVRGARVQKRRGGGKRKERDGGVVEGLWERRVLGEVLFGFDVGKV